MCKFDLMDFNINLRGTNMTAETESDLGDLVKDLTVFADSTFDYSNEYDSDYNRRDRRRFCELFNRAEAALNRPRAELAAKLVVSQPMLEAWATGRGAPLPRGRRTSLRVLADLVVA
jgi:hypothetical protein